MNSIPSKRVSAADRAKAAQAVCLVIDVQDGCVKRMPDTAREKFLAEVKQSVEELREKDIPPVWVSIGDHTKLYMAQASTQTSTDLSGVSEALGIKPGELVYHKRLMSALADKADVIQRPSDFAGEQSGNDLRTLEASFHGKALSEHLKDTQQTIIMGMMTTYCVTKTAIDAAKKGFNPVVITDRLVHGDDLNRTQPAKWHKEQIKQTIKQLGHSPEDLGIRFCTFAEFKAGLTNTPRLQNSPSQIPLTRPKARL